MNDPNLKPKGIKVVGYSCILLCLFVLLKLIEHAIRTPNFQLSFEFVLSSICSITLITVAIFFMRKHKWALTVMKVISVISIGSSITSGLNIILSAGWDVIHLGDPHSGLRIFIGLIIFSYSYLFIMLLIYLRSEAVKKHFLPQ